MKNLVLSRCLHSMVFLLGRKLAEDWLWIPEAGDWLPLELASSGHNTALSGCFCFLSRMDKEGLTRAPHPLMLPVLGAIAGSKISRELKGSRQMG